MSHEIEKGLEKKSTDEARRQSGVKKTVGLLVLAMAVIVGLFLNRFFTGSQVSAEKLSELGAKEFLQPRRFDHVELLDHTGKVFDHARFKDTWSLVFFGFTSCPDICPTTLAELRTMTVGLEADIAANTQVILTTVDPARDTPEKLAEYVHYFSDDFIGLTGEFLKVLKFAQQLNAAFRKVPGGGDDYQVEHSGHIMLINPRGDYHGYIRPPFDAQSIEAAYLALRKNYRLKYGGQ